MICKSDRNSEIHGIDVHFIHPSVTLKASMASCFYKGHLSLLSESNPALASCMAYKRNDTKHYSLIKGERFSLRHGCFLGIAKKPDSRKKLPVPYADGSLFTEMLFGEEEVEQVY